MRDLFKLIMGLISGFALLFLNSEIVHDTIGKVTTMFNPEKVSVLDIFLSRLCTILSFIGIFIIIIYIVIIFKKILFDKAKI